MYKWLVVLMTLLVSSCQSANQGAALQADHPGLGPLAQSVQASSVALQAAAQQFQSAGEQFATLAAVNDSSVHSAIAATQQQYDDAIEAATAVGAANAGVDEAADTTFREWQIEAGVFTDPRLKADSQAKLSQAWQGYQNLSQVQRQALAAMDPVLAQMNRTVSALNANPSASTVASLAPDVNALQSAIDGVVRNLQSAATAADTFNSSIE